ncbi:hypothetical protein [Butyrivibrio sp. NC2007]|uniref:hypothetical protein n=1 Tax=Butyrivibrio sp. NC2007 TaxID=1280683 RepID=UPI0003B5928F|nr:hypothetical protein [Butyrivibrio sp. NC2007]
MQETTQLTYGTGTVTIMESSQSEIEVAAPEIRFGDYYKAVEACFTARELEEISEGSNAALEFRYSMTDELDDEDEVQRFEEGIEKAEMLTGSLNSGVYFEVEAEKSVSGGEKSEIDTLYDEVEFQYEIPRYLVAEKRVYYAMTNVMGVCELEKDVDEEADTLSISTRDVGTTLILYQDGKENDSREHSRFAIKTQYLFLLAIVALVLVWWALERHNRRS